MSRTGEMAEVGDKAEEKLREITECPICLSVFTDPRVLSCIHTFCFECLKHTADATQKNPGDKMSCPLCRKEFIIPEDGMHGVQKNVFMENLLLYKTTLQMGSSTIICDMCNIRNDGKVCEIPKATRKCLECQDYYCDSCVKVHQFQKVTKDHQMVNIGSDMKSDRNRLISMKSCSKHIHKLLDYYCAECRKVVCVSCFIENHASHKCKDVTTVDEEFRKTIEKKASHMPFYMKEMLFMRKDNDKRKEDFLKEIVDKEKEIYKRNQELKDMIDQHTKSLLHELSLIKSKHLKEIESVMEEIDRYFTIFSSFRSYCTELTLKGSPSDVCSSVDQLIVRADDLERDHEAFVGRPHKSFEVSFQATDLGDVLQNVRNNLVGNVEAKTEAATQYAVVVGLDGGTTTISKSVVKINLLQPNAITAQEQIPTTMAEEAVAAVYDNTMYVAGIGVRKDEIWKYNQTSGWIKCASLVEGRGRHSAAFIDEVLYICGGFVYSTKVILDSVEAFNAVTNKYTTVGKLVHAVERTGNCVPYKRSLYIFGGSDNSYKHVNHVQVYNTKENTCTLISKPMLHPYNLMRAVLWETSVILTGRYTSFIFNIETEIWQERPQFKTDVIYFGLVLENGRVFIIGGVGSEDDADGHGKWRCRDDVRYVPLQSIIDDKPIDWKIHGKLPKPSLVHVWANMLF